MEDGHHLAELRRYYRQYRQQYLQWVDRHSYPAEQALPNYRRACIAWYEASIDPVNPYEGEVFPFLTGMAEMYYGGAPPLTHVPPTIVLDPRGQQLLHQLREAGRCGELLVLADYHRLGLAALQRVLDLPAEAVTEELQHCRETLAGPDQEPLLWQSVITLAGRQDLIATLEREEAPPPEPPAPAAPPKEMPAVTLSRRKPRIGLPTPALLLAAVLFGLLLYLLYDTFYRPTPAGLYAEYFEPYPDIFADDPPQTEDERDLQRILYYYDRGDYRTAYEELLPTADAYPAAPLYLGVSALALGDAPRARQWLSRVPADSPYRDAAEWYDALAQLHSGGAAGAKITMESIARSTGHPYRGPAQRLLSDL